VTKFDAGLLAVKALTLPTTSADLTENTLTCIPAMQTLKLYSTLLPHPLQDALHDLLTMTTCTRIT